MRHFRMLAIATSALGLTAFVLAAPAPQETPTAIITAHNAHQLRVLKEVPKRAQRIIRGPQRGELTLLDWNHSAEVVDDVSFRTLRAIAKDFRPTDLAISADGKLRTWTQRAKSDYIIEETATGKAFNLEVGDSAGYSAFSPDGRHLAIGKTFWDPNAHGVGHSETNLYDASGKLLRTLGKTGPGAVRPLFSPDGKTLAIGNRNRETLLFEVATGNLLHKLDKPMIQEIAFSPDGKTLAAGYVDGTVALWDVVTGKLLHSASSGCQEIYSVDWNPKGDVLASSGRDGKIVLWEPTKFTKLKELDAPFWVIQVRFTADGTRLLSSSASDYGAKNDRKITVWAVGEGVR